MLVVDDDPIMLEVLRERLEHAGFQVTTRSEALGTALWIATHQPDIVLLDVVMPALSGGELASLMRRRAIAESAGVIFHSSKPETELQALVDHTGALGAISKSHDERAFMCEFNRLAGGRRTS